MEKRRDCGSLLAGEQFLDSRGISRGQFEIASEAPLATARLLFEEVVEVLASARNFAGAGYLEPLLGSLVTLHLRHRYLLTWHGKPPPAKGASARDVTFFR